MGKDLKGKELGVGISQRSDEFYVGRYTTKHGKRKQKLFRKLQECRQWLADSQYQDEHSNLNFPEEMTVKAWFDYCISMKKRTVRPNTVRNYTERFERNINPVIAKLLLSEVKPIQCQLIMNRMADEAIEILKRQKQKNAGFKIIPMEWAEFVFLCKKGTPVQNSNYDTMLFKSCEKIGIPKFSMHVLRHTFATRCIEGGMKPKTLQTILGHSNIGITMNLYVHTTEDEKQKEIEKIAAALKVV